MIFLLLIYVVLIYHLSLTYCLVKWRCESHTLASNRSSMRAIVHLDYSFGLRHRLIFDLSDEIGA